ncbi:MAG: hypothetical protein RIC12_02080, partial [Pirellulales bacterium]
MNAFWALVLWLRGLCLGRATLATENLALRQQLLCYADSHGVLNSMIACGQFNQPTCNISAVNDLRSSKIQSVGREQGLTLICVSIILNGFDYATSQHHEFYSHSLAALCRHPRR